MDRISRTLLILLTCLLITLVTLAGCLWKRVAENEPETNMVHLSTSTIQTNSLEGITSTPESNPDLAVTLTAQLSVTPTLTATPEFTATPVFTATPIASPTPKPPPFLDSLIENLKNGEAWQVVGVYVEDSLSLRVVQQPSSDPAFVSSIQNTATYFALVNQVTGNTGLLAHNYLAGAYFFNLRPGQIVILIYGDGRTEEYEVSGFQEYQALSPNSPTSNFVNLDSGETLSSTDLFYRVYGGGTRTTLQTCIAQGNESSWGRLFVIAPLY